MLCFSDRASLVAALTAYAGSTAAAHELIARCVGRLFAGSGDREILARTAAGVKLQGGTASAFVRILSEMREGAVSGEDERRLLRFYQQLSMHWLLTPLFDEPGA
jgi:hypothetical protein